MNEISRHKFIFIGGLHKSGTSILSRCLREHPLISGFKNTESPEDEGQYLQTVYLPEREFGGPGLFGLNPSSRLDGGSPLITGENAKKIFSQWSEYWDLSKEYLLEKSPPNLIRTRFLQALLPNSFFIIIQRHPIPVSCATIKWTKGVTFEMLIEHYIKCHEIFRNDKKELKNVIMIRYEDFIKDPLKVLNNICGFLGIDRFTHLPEEVSDRAAQKYFSVWRGLSFFHKCYLILKYGRQVKEFGYSLRV